MDLSVIIVSWKVKEKLRANLSALLPSLKDLSAEVFVVDNDSEDGTVDMVRMEFPEVKVIANSDNRGFAAANNQAIREAKGDYILLLNPDMLVSAETIPLMLAWACSNPQATVSGCRLEDGKGKLIPHVRRWPHLSDQLAVVLKLPHLFPYMLDSYLQVGFNYEREAKVDSIRGAFFLINRQSWQKISGFYEPFLDERYFIWFEEVDFCRQVYKNGGEVWYTPAAICVDYVGQSFRQVNITSKQNYFQESMLAYFKKWEPLWQYYVLKIMWPFGRWLAKFFA